MGGDGRFNESGVVPPHSQRDWPHAPAHRLEEPGAYIVTAGTYGKEAFFNTPERLTLVRDRLFELALENDWKLQAWAIMNNHYHFVALSPKDSGSLKNMLSKLHMLTAKDINLADGRPERKVWYQFWDSHITFEKSYFARLNYVHQNPVKHGLVANARFYEWCSANWFELKASRSFFKMVSGFKTDRVNVFDVF